MARVLIRCPITESLVPTGVSIADWGDLDHLDPAMLLIACSDCGRDHESSPEDAVLGLVRIRKTPVRTRDAKPRAKWPAPHERAQCMRCGVLGSRMLLVERYADGSGDCRSLSANACKCRLATNKRRELTVPYPA